MRHDAGSFFRREAGRQRYDGGLAHTDPAMRTLLRLTALAALLGSGIANADEGRASFRALFEELVETNTTLSAGSCTEAAQRMARHLREAGLAEQDLQIVTVPDHPREGNLVARLRGSAPGLAPMLLLAHIDVVEARREDWQRDPFTLVEENGYFYARGVADDKAMASIWVDSMLRALRGEFRPRREIRLALTCGEETNGAFNGAQYLVNERKALIDAAFALNEGAWGILDEKGRRVMMSVQAGEKASQNYRLEVTNPGGHSSRPVKENAIYRLSKATLAVAAHEFPVQLNDTTRVYFTRMSEILGGETGDAMRALVADPADTRAVATVTADPSWNAMLRTTCVATTLEAGHATNALPQRARANVNCRIYPGSTPEDVRRELERVIADPAVAVSTLELRGPVAKAPPLSPAIMGPVESVAAKIYPGVPVVPVFLAGATDGQFLNAAGIPTYGIGGIFFDKDLGGVHGLDERLRVESLYAGRDYLFELVKQLADSPDPVP